MQQDKQDTKRTIQICTIPNTNPKAPVTHKSAPPKADVLFDTLKNNINKNEKTDAKMLNTIFLISNSTIT